MTEPRQRRRTRALIFDFDGLILDTETPEFRAWTEIYEEHGVQLDFETWAVCIGTVGAFDPYDELERRIGGPIDREAIRTQRRRRNQELLQVEAVRPGVLDYVTEARQQRMGLAVASSSTLSWVGGHLERLGIIGLFDHVRTSDNVSQVKPDPELYLAALGALGVEAGEAIALEDSPNGVLAAKRAGIYCVAVPNALTRRLTFEHADRRIDSLGDLPLRRLLESM